MRNRIIELAKANGADIVGFAPASRFEKDNPIFKIMPETKTVIGLAFRILRGIYRGIEEGSTYYQYTTMAVENMEETIMPMAQLKVANLIEEASFQSGSGIRCHLPGQVPGGADGLSGCRCQMRSG